MRLKIYLISLFNLFFLLSSFSQTKKTQDAESKEFFNYAYWNGVADKQHLSASEKEELISGQKKIFDESHSHTHVDEKDILWVETPFVQPSPGKGYGQGSTTAGPCQNIDFEAGSFTGWTRTTGYNPLTNTLGCCPNPNGDQTIMSGAGTDPFGGFPVVYPGGGSFSLRLGSIAIGGIADRISQTFFVTPANANFTYRYAAVLNDGGHNAAQQPRFTSEIIDTVGNAVPCTFYQVSAASSVTGYSTSSSNAASGSPVIYKNWTNVAVDLSPNIGQNVTLRFTVYDCSPTGHFAYAYIDGVCTNFATSIADTTCPNIPITMCAPAGFSTTTWNGPGVVNDPNQCISTSIPGTYTCTTILVPGCPGPTFTHTLGILPDPAVSFTPVTAGACSKNYTFNSTISIPIGTIVSFSWNFGDNSTSTLANPTHTYAAPGTYPVKLRAISSRGCIDSVINYITIFPFPNISFSPPSHCVLTVVQFTNSSTIPVGSITSYSWAFGNGNSSLLTNPSSIYPSSGTWIVTLTAVSNQGCSSTLTQSLGIFPAPSINFTAAPLCDIVGTTFAPSTSTAISSGSLASFLWDFGDGTTSTAPQPVHSYSAPGVYNVSLTALSNHQCSATATNTFTILPSPTVAFATTSLNACSPNFTFTNNSAISTGTLTSLWSFGGTNTTSVFSPTYSFPGTGNYTIALIGTSNNGCSDTAFHYVSIYPYPIINFSVPASCENAVFTVSTTAPTGSVTSYAWNFGDPASGSNNTSSLQNPTHSYTSTNVYTISLNIVSNINCPSSYSTQITVFPNPLASFSYSTLNNCSLPFTFANSSSVSSIGASSITSYSWNFGGSLSSATSPNYSFPAPGNYSVSLIAKTNHNCSDTMSANISVYPPPFVSFTASPVCQNITATFVANSSISAVPAPGSITSYTWNFGDGAFASVLSPQSHSYNLPGTYTVALSATSNKNCVTTVTNSLAIYPMPVIDFTTTSNMCFGNITQFTSTNSIASGTLFSFNWDFGDSNFGSNPVTSHSYVAAGTYPVSYSVTSNDECASVLTKTITVFPTPVASFTAPNGCFGSASTYTDLSTITNSPANFINVWNWKLGDGATSNFQNPAAHTYTTFGTYTPTLTVTSNNGCVNTATSNLIIHPLPIVAFSPTGACVGSAVQFTNNSSIPLGSITSYIWDFSDGTPTVGVTAPVHTYTVASPYTVTLTATSNQGCSKTSTTNLTIYPYPSVSLTPINSSCVNDVVFIYPNASITGGNNPISGYTLSYGDGSPATLTTSLQYTVPHTYTAYNTYTVSFSAISNGCKATTTSTVNVYPKPFANFVSSNFCFNSNTQFVNTSTIAATYSIQQHNWNFGDGASPSSSLANTSHTFSGPGTYSVTLTEYTFPETGLTCSISATKIITINPLPGPAFITNSVCAGNLTSFTNTSAALSQTITGWSWYYYNNGQLNSNSQNPVYTYTSSGTFTAMLKAVNNFGCSDSITNPVAVWANPAPSFTAPSGCLNTVTNFTESTTIANTASNSISGWLWSFGDATPTVTTQNPAHNYIVFGTYTPTLLVTSNKGCTGSTTRTVTIHPLPTVTFSPPGGCVNTNIQFVNSSTIALGSIPSYLWNFNDGTTSTLTSPAHNYTLDNVYNVTLTATSNQGCVNSATRVFTVHPFPSVNPYPLSNSCINDTVRIATNISITGTNNAVTYTLNYGDGSSTFTNSVLSLTVTHPYTTINPNNTFTITLTAISNSCLATSQTTVKIYPKAYPNFSATKFCLNDTTSFVNTSTITAGSSIGSYNWDFDDGAFSTSNATNPKHVFQTATVHHVSLTAMSYPEGSVTCIATGVKNVTINPLPPLVPFTSNTVCLGNPTQFSNTTPTAGIMGWSWYDNNGSLFSISQSPSFIYPNSGTFSVSLTALNNFGCRKTEIDSVHVNPNPVASFSTNNVCFTNQNSFTNLSTTLEGSLSTYTWNTNGNPNFSSNYNSTYIYSTPGTYSVQLIVGSNLGCIGKTTNTLEVYFLPDVSFTANEACFGKLTQYSNNSSIPNGFINGYTWTFADPTAGTNSISTVTHPSHLFPTTGSIGTTLQAVSDHNCVNTKVSNIIVHSNPFANFTNTLICVGDNLSFSNLSTSSDGTLISHQWDFNGDNVIDKEAETPTFSYSLHGNYNVKLIVQTQYGCLDDTVRSVFANPKATAAFASDNKAGCPPLCISFKDLSTIPQGTFTTQWEFGDGSPAENVQNATHCYNSGIFDLNLTLTSDVGCRTKFKHPGYVSVYSVPTAGFKVEPEEVDEDDPTITVTNDASSDVEFNKYYISDGTSYGNPNFTHTIKGLKQTKPMIVQIVKNHYGCSDTVYRVLDIKPTYVIYVPNVFTPNGDETNDGFGAKGVGILKFAMQIYDRWGHMVFSSTDIYDTWDGTSKGSGEPIKEDVYTWKIQVTDVFNKNHNLIGHVSLIK
jgi:gliding motility-associated-like protein